MKNENRIEMEPWRTPAIFVYHDEFALLKQLFWQFSRK